VPIIYTYLRTKPPVDHEAKLERQERGDIVNPELSFN
jgi:hypothetical protein